MDRYTRMLSYDLPRKSDFQKNDVSLKEENDMMKRISTQPPCKICKADKLRLYGKRYGLLESCKHVLCLDCVRKFNVDLILRNRRLILDPNNIAVSCPVCNKPSSCIMSQSEFVSQTVLKLKYVREFSEFVKDLPCPYFRKGLGTCLCDDPSSHSIFKNTFLNICAGNVNFVNILNDIPAF